MLDIADGVDIVQDRVYKHQAVVFYHKGESENSDPKNCTPHIRATYRKTNEVKFYEQLAK